MDSFVLRKTNSICPICLQKIPAKRILDQDDVYLEKTCSEHGFFRTIIWRGKPGYIQWERNKIPNHPQTPLTQAENGCPFDCGPCAAHRQEPCCVLLEVTQRCDLNCPVCFASAGEFQIPDPDMTLIRKWYETMLEAGGPFNIHLTGGEPSLRDDLPEVITLGREMGFSYFQLNTNGLRISKDVTYLAKLKEAGLKVVYLQFDGTEDSIYRQIRGRELIEIKTRAIENCRSMELGVVLVPTISPAVNADNLGEIIRYALNFQPVVRGIHFQPITYFGRYPRQPENEDRITIPELIRGMEEQTHGLVSLQNFSPKGSENSYCYFHATFVVMPDGSLKSIKQQETGCCCKTEDAREGLEKSKAYVNRNWVYPDFQLDTGTSTSSMGEWDSFLNRAKTHLFSISGMAFQDAWNLDLELLQDCCINVASPDLKLIPFCAYNLTNTSGNTLYRPA